eukprot:TRINITY_DN83129_c0_g1_i1.p1 TRINITY_DN83129_c0_g1~~TRINITY_DN83129_c0_g1_i1.p1  ORF type:complete len:533 (+),score=139.69 TRINITY_DN83129_c0_g1_i1:87-1601(+)
MASTATSESRATAEDPGAAGNGNLSLEASETTYQRALQPTKRRKIDVEVLKELKVVDGAVTGAVSTPDEGTLVENPADYSSQRQLRLTKANLQLHQTMHEMQQQKQKQAAKQQQQNLKPKHHGVHHQHQSRAYSGLSDYCWSKRCHRALLRLAEAIADFPREARRDALDKVPDKAKKVLLRFMEINAGSKGSRAVVCEGKSKKLFAKCSQGKTKDVPPTAPIRDTPSGGVSLKRGGYVARLRLLPYLHVTTHCEATWDGAARLYKVLQRARDIVTLRVQTRGTIDPDDVMKLLSSACTEHGMLLNDLGLSFCAAVDAHAVIGCTVSGSYTTSLREAIEHREQLLEGKAAGWPKLRQAWIQVMKAQVKRRTSRAWGQGSPKARGNAVAEAIADHAWQTFSLRQKAEESARRCRKLKQAVCYLQKVLLDEDRAQGMRRLRLQQEAALAHRRATRVALKQEKRRREEKWRWLKDRSRTMAELLSPGKYCFENSESGASCSDEQQQQQ